jgi:hypothetical protein
MNTKNDAGIRDAGCGVRTGEFERICDPGCRTPDPGPRIPFHAERRACRFHSSSFVV